MAEVGKREVRVDAFDKVSDWEPSAASETMSREMIHFSNGKK